MFDCLNTYRNEFYNSSFQKCKPGAQFCIATFTLWKLATSMCADRTRVIQRVMLFRSAPSANSSRNLYENF